MVVVKLSPNLLNPMNFARFVSYQEVDVSRHTNTVSTSNKPVD